jgi:hypothetical protein
LLFGCRRVLAATLIKTHHGTNLTREHLAGCLVAQHIVLNLKEQRGGIPNRPTALAVGLFAGNTLDRVNN